jgi:hypothetical protein
MGGVVIEE